MHDRVYTRACVVCLTFEGFGFMVRPEMSKKRCGKHRAHLCTSGQGQISIWLLPVGWGRTRAAPGFYNLQVALAAFFSFRLRRDGSFLVVFSKLE